jgi:hypothetical protein
MIGIDVFKLARQVACVRFADMAGIGRAPTSTTTIEGIAAVTAHEISVDEEDEGEEEGGDSRIGGR